jgi:hypothetical protein
MTILKHAVLAASLALTTLPAFAQDAQQQAVFRQYCSGDYMRLCSAYNPGSPEVEQCFQARMRELSPGCQNAIAEYTKKERGSRRR